MYTCTCRFVNSQLTSKCRREVLLEHFQEPKELAECEGPCCDVCEAQIECEDATTHIRTVLEVIQNMPNFGEVKVRRTHPLAKLSCICTQIAEAIRGSSKAKESAPKSIVT